MSDSPTEARRAELFQQLQELYQGLPTSEGENPCGTCRECCTGKGLTFHNVTNLELEFIAHNGEGERIPDFRRFLHRRGDVEVCPYFDDEIWGCGIYQIRPFSCRLFGNYRTTDTTLPEVCVFQGQEKIFERHQYFAEVPGAQKLKDLVRDFWPYQRLRFHDSENSDGPPVSPFIGGDELDEALMLQSEGRLEEALGTLATAEIDDTPYSLYCVALILEGLGRHQEAALALGEALKEADECAPLHFRLACNLLSLGASSKAEGSLKRTLELEPDHIGGLSLLAGIYLATNQPQSASKLLKRAATLDPENPQVQRLLLACG